MEEDLGWKGKPYGAWVSELSMERGSVSTPLCVGCGTHRISWPIVVSGSAIEDCLLPPWTISLSGPFEGNSGC